MTLQEYIGQDHLVGQNGAIKKIIDNKHLQSLILYGDPGIGKTTLANIIADNLNIFRINVNATNLSMNELKEIQEHVKFHQKVVLIVDEVHRLDKNKQNFLLPFLEKETIYLIGTTTENPYFTVNSALRSRLLLFQLKPLSEYELVHGLYKHNLNQFPDTLLSQDDYEEIHTISNGDVRMALNILKFLINNYSHEEINPKLINQIFEKNHIYGLSESKYHDLLSAFQKSIRASDVNAALHYSALLLTNGDELSLLRRMIITAYEDIGLANPQACQRTEIAAQAFQRVGMPEGRIIIANCIVELALSPKSTSAYQALDLAFDDVKNKHNDEIPNWLLKNQPHQTTYDRNVANTIDNLPKNLQGTKYYHPQNSSQYEEALAKNYINRKKN